MKGKAVLIESDWNLKNGKSLIVVLLLVCINRIRLEFKATISNIESGMFRVLIESDWNLKETCSTVPSSF